MIEEDLIFPGKPNDNSEISPSVSMELEHDRWSSQNSQLSKIRVQTQSLPTSPSGTMDALIAPVSASSTATTVSPLTPITNLSSISPETPAVSPDYAKYVVFTGCGLD